MLTMIFACDLNGAIGKDGDLPWRQTTDLKHFKEITEGNTIVMGRKTWDSLPGKLPNRRHIVMSRSAINDVETCSYDEVISLAKNKNIFIIGGGEIYKLFLDEVDVIHRTIIHCNISGADTFAPTVDESVFKIIEERFTIKSSQDQFDMTFQKLVRREF